MRAASRLSTLRMSSTRSNPTLSDLHSKMPAGQPSQPTTANSAARTTTTGSSNNSSRPPSSSSWVASLIMITLGPFLSAAPGVPQHASSGRSGSPVNAYPVSSTTTNQTNNNQTNGVLAFLLRLVNFVVPKSIRELMSFKMVDRVSHQLAQDVLEDMALEDTKETEGQGEPKDKYVAGKQESASDPRVVRPPSVEIPIRDGNASEGILRIVELELPSGPAEVDVLYWHPRLTDSNSKSRSTDAQTNGNVQNVFLMISGNPGVVDFYNEFCTAVHSLLPGGDTAIFATGHIGHSTLLAPPPNFGHSLAEQIEAKIALVQLLLKRYPDANIFLAGHSIGAWMASRVLAALESEPRIKSLYLLFPTLERIVETPNGQRQHKMFKAPYKQLLSFLIQAIRSAMPLDALTDLVGKLSHQPRNCAKITARRLLSYSTVYSALNMSDDEMREVDLLDSPLFQRNAGRIRGYYSTRDSWVPLEHYHHIRSILEPLGEQERMEMDLFQIPHAFVLDSGDAEWVAGVVARWIVEDSGRGGVEEGEREGEEEMAGKEEVEEPVSPRSGWSAEEDGGGAKDALI